MSANAGEGLYVALWIVSLIGLAVFLAHISA